MLWLYETWLYENVINTIWFIRIILITVFTLNILSPIIIFFYLAEVKMKFNISGLLKKWKNQKQTTGYN